MNQSYYQLTYAFGPSNFVNKKTGCQFYSKKGKKYIGFVGNFAMIEKILQKTDGVESNETYRKDIRRYI